MVTGARPKVFCSWGFPEAGLSILREHADVQVWDGPDGAPREVLLEALRGGDARANAEIARRILAGDRGAARDIVLLNAGAGLFLAGRAASVREGITCAAAAIDDGRAAGALAHLARLSHGEASDGGHQ